MSVIFLPKMIVKCINQGTPEEVLVRRSLFRSIFGLLLPINLFLNIRSKLADFTTMMAVYAFLSLITAVSATYLTLVSLWAYLGVGIAQPLTTTKPKKAFTYTMGIMTIGTLFFILN
ncbi:MAG: hypothetical protein ACJAT7_002374 [Psychromonas sp.]|jgi:hypothetical protein